MNETDLELLENVDNLVELEKQFQEKEKVKSFFKNVILEIKMIRVEMRLLREYIENKRAKRRLREGKRITKKLRKEILERDKKCISCGSKENLQVDHIIPVSKGGTNDPTNLQTLCVKCNTKKGWW